MKSNKLDNVQISMLNQLYGKLLTNKQNQAINLYYDSDYSLAEIAEEVSISRQAVRDCIVKAEATLNEMEEKLGLFKRLQTISSSCLSLLENSNLDTFSRNIIEQILKASQGD